VIARKVYIVLCLENMSIRNRLRESFFLFQRKKSRQVFLDMLFSGLISDRKVE